MTSETQDDFTHNYDTTTAALIEGLFASWQNTLGNIKHSYAMTADTLVDEILITINQKQINDALNRFVVQNIGLLLQLRLELFDGYLRLYCIADVLGLHLSVASNFKLTQIRLDKHQKRLVFEQISETDILDLHAKTWWKAPAILLFVRWYQRFFKKDPLPFLLSLSPKLKGLPFIEYKDNFIYLQIGRWFPKSFHERLKKIQVNRGVVKPEQLLLQVQPNFVEILSFGDPNADIITQADNPNNQAS